MFIIVSNLAFDSSCSAFLTVPVISLYKETKAIRINCWASMSTNQDYNGTRVGYSIVQTLNFPTDFAKEMSQNIPNRELRDDGISLPCALHHCFKDSYPSMSAARKAVRRGEILTSLEGANTVCNTSNTVFGGEVFFIQKRLQPGLFPQGTAPFEMQVVYEDDHIAVVVKPPGVVTTKNKGQNGRLAVKSGLAYWLRPTLDTIDPLWRPVPAHRLDSATGGLLLAAKTRRAIVDLTSQFVDRRVRKRYVALVGGRPSGEDGGGRGRIAEPLGGQEALTDYEVMESVRSLKHGWVSAVSLRPHTGRTHQVLATRMSQCHAPPRTPSPLSHV